MASFDLEPIVDRVLIVSRLNALKEQVFAVIKALPAVDVGVFTTTGILVAIARILHQVVICIRIREGRGIIRRLSLVLLVQHELRALDGVALIVDLVHVVAIREGDDVIPWGLVLLMVIVRARVVAVVESGGVNVALDAELSVLVELGGEVYVDRYSVEVLNRAAVLALPGQGELELVVAGVIVIDGVVRHRFAVDRNLLNARCLVEGQRVLHLVLEGDVVLLVARYVLGQLCRELEWHIITNVVVGGVIPLDARD